MLTTSLLIALVGLAAKAPKVDPYAPVALYDGKWSVLATGKKKPDVLENHCAKTGRFYVCEQTVNGIAGSLIVFLPSGKPGHYFTQALAPDALAKGRGELVITGAHWEYTSQDADAGTTTHYRTLNDFSEDGATIHFDVQKSSDGVTWETTLSGVETRSKSKALSPPAPR